MPFATDLPSRVVLRRERNVFNASVRDLADGIVVIVVKGIEGCGRCIKGIVIVVEGVEGDRGGLRLGVVGCAVWLGVVGVGHGRCGVSLR